MIDIQLKYGSAKIPVSISEGSTLSELMEVVAKETDVPSARQKLILNGRALTSMDHEKSLQECGVINFSKIMVLGKRYDPEEDELYKQIENVEKKSLEIDAKLAEVEVEFRDIENGHLAEEHHEKALKGLLKRCRSGTEEFMRLLEKLDAMRFDEHQSESKNKRKRVVDQVNKWLDKNDTLLTKIEEVFEKFQK